MSFPRYPSYRDSGVEWLGAVPSHWVVQRLRFVAEINPSKSEVSHLTADTEVSFLPMEAIGDDGSVQLDRVRPLADVQTGYTYFRDGDVTIAKITPCFENGKGAAMRNLCNGIGFGTTELIVMRPKPAQTTSTYLHWLFTSHPFRKAGEAFMYGAGGQKRVPDEFVRDFSIGFPPLAEQVMIAAFLGRETAKIDALVEEQKRLIELLKEKRQAVISQAVTKGLDPSVPMKDSGVEWLGKVPAHWKSPRLKALFRQEKRQGFADKEVLSVYREFGVILKDSRTDNFNKTPEDLSSYQLVRIGDLVVNKMKAWQGSLGISSLEGITSPDYVVFAPLHAEASDYLHLLLRSRGMVSTYLSISNGIRLAQWRLEPEAFLTQHVFLPPAEEQRAIADFVGEQMAKWDSLMSEAERGIDLLQQRRSALISAAVTGKIDVRGLGHRPHGDEPPSRHDESHDLQCG